jgi:tRNA nucleotidyltransferase (CCA-adding enzyme)
MKDMNIKKRVVDVPQHIIYLSDVLYQHGVVIYLVGGYVRNALLSLPATDIDITSKAKPQEIVAILSDKPGFSIIEKAPDFGTVQIDLFFEGQKYSFEHTTFRHDFYHEGGAHRPKHVAFTDDIKRDATRRDFTINAIYYNIQSDEMVDPLNGIVDLHNMVIKAAKTDAKKTLSDDGLRILRMVRFASELNFKIDASLFHAAKKYGHYLVDISAERKYIELKKILLADTKYKGYNGAFKTLKHKRGLIALQQINAFKYTFPSMLEGIGVAQNPEYHAYDVFTHGLYSCYASKPDLALRLSALMHDIAKPVVKRETGFMYGHDKRGADITKEQLNALKAPKKLISEVCMLVKNHMFDLEGNAKTNTIKKKAAIVGFKNMRKLADLRRADFIGSGKRCRFEMADHWEKIVDEMIEKNTPQSIADLNISGIDLIDKLHIDQGKDIGAVLDRLYKITVLKPNQNKKDILLRYAKKMIEQGEI